MAYANADDQRRCWREWYGRNKADVLGRVNERKRKRRLLIRSMKLKCMRCPESDPSCLDFHHRDPSEKETTVAAILRRNWSDDRIMAEIAKCDVLCSNCHRKLHFALSSNGRTSGFDPENAGSSPAEAAMTDR